ncbi:hypothetical protein [Nocardia yamanashiensis]|uniref:hypothetical protein n=1 Tax=Nocardia yamanashiensis TaxID=209247 RepID=UPI000829E6C6|nr:hypothetical protein [Nocardia yamanashiensis]
MSEGDVRQLRSLWESLKALNFRYGRPEAEALAVTIKSAMSPKLAPKGDPAAVFAQAEIYRIAADASKKANAALHTVTSSDLPEAWRGRAADTHTEVLDASTVQAQGITASYETGHATLNDFHDDLRQAHDRDRNGCALLQDAAERIDAILAQSPPRGADYELALSPIREIALQGCTDRLTAAKTATENVQAYIDRLESAIRDSPGARFLKDPDGALASAYLADLLTPTEMATANQRRRDMTPAEYNSFTGLLAQATSASEVAALWKALGSSRPYSPAELAALGQALRSNIPPGASAGHASTPDKGGVVVPPSSDVDLSKPHTPNLREIEMTPPLDVPLAVGQDPVPLQGDVSKSLPVPPPGPAPVPPDKR